MRLPCGTATWWAICADASLPPDKYVPKFKCDAAISIWYAMQQGIFFHIASSRIFSFFNLNRLSSHIMTFSELQIKRRVGLIAALFSFCLLLTAEYLVWHLVFEPGLNNLSLCVWRSMRQMHARWLMWNSQRQRELFLFTYRELRVEHRFYESAGFLKFFVTNLVHLVVWSGGLIFRCRWDRRFTLISGSRGSFIQQRGNFLNSGHYTKGTA